MTTRKQDNSDSGIELIQRGGLSKELSPPAWVQAILVFSMLAAIVLFVLSGLL